MTQSANTHLLRELAPFSERVWNAIDDEARERLRPLLAARRVVDWVDEGGWHADIAALGRTGALSKPPPGAALDRVKLRQRQVLPLSEVRVPFAVSRSEIDDLERGAQDPELDDLTVAAGQLAGLENRAVFHGWPESGVAGMAEVAPYPESSLGNDCREYPGLVAQAVDQLRCNGIEGPYTLAISPAGYTSIVRTAEQGGVLLLDHLTKILGGQLVWAPSLDGALVLSMRGGDFRLHVGQDTAVGYSHHDGESVHLYLEETFTFHVSEPDAALWLRAALP